MTWLYIPRSGTSASTQVEEALTSDCTERCRTLAASATWRSRPRPLAHWLRLWKRERWMRRLCGLMPEPLTADASVASWLALLEEAPARSSPSPTPSERTPQRNGSPQTEGASSSDSLTSPESVEPNGSSGKTLEGQLLLFPSCSSGWNRRAGVEHGQAFVRLMLAKPTGGHASLCWPTVTVCGNYNYKGASPTSGDGLATVALRLMQLLDGMASSPRPSNSPPRSLNPIFVAWLMGWTWWLEGWDALTSCASSAMESCQSKPPPQSGSSGLTASEKSEAA